MPVEDAATFFSVPPLFALSTLNVDNAGTKYPRKVLVCTNISNGYKLAQVIFDAQQGHVVT